MAEFKFNLLPKKSKEVIIKEKKRDSNSVYYSLLVLFGILIWFGLTLLNTLIVDKSNLQRKQIIKDKQDVIENEFYETRRIHGELVVKTNIIAPLLKDDIDPETLFRVGEEVFGVTDDVVIVGYGRNDDGTFSIKISAPDNQMIAEKARQLKNLALVTDLVIKDVTQRTASEQIVAEFNFSIDSSLL